MTSEVDNTAAGTFVPPVTAPPASRVSDTAAWCLVIVPVAYATVDAGIRWIWPSYGFGNQILSTAISVALITMAFREAKNINASGANPKGVQLKWWCLFIPVYLVQRARALGRGWLFPFLSIASIILIIAVTVPTILSGDIYWRVGIPRCDEAITTKQLMEIANSKYKEKNLNFSLVSLDNFQDQGIVEKTRTCSAVAHFSDNDQLPISYTVTDRGNDYWFQIVKIGSH